MNQAIQKMKKPLVGVISAAILLSAPIGVWAADKGNAKQDSKEKKKVEKMPKLPIESEAAYLYDMNLNKVIYSKKPNKELPISGLSQVMSMYVASDALSSGKVKANEKVKISEKAWRTPGSRMFLEIGREVPFGELFKGIAIVSGNDASVALAEHLKGSTESFVDEMNKKATELKMKHTTFYSVNGLPQNDNEDVSTASDLGTMTISYLKKYPGNLAIHSLKQYKFDTGREVIEQANRNPLLQSYKAADGLKTGGSDGNYNLIGTAEKDGIRLVVVTLKGETEKVRAKDAKTLLDYGFNQYKKYVFDKKGDKVETLPVYKAKETKKASVIVKDDVEVIIHSSKLSKKNKVKEKVVLPEYINAGKGLKAGDVVGKKQIFIGEKMIHETDIVVKEDIEKGSWWQKALDSLLLIGMWIMGLFKG